MSITGCCGGDEEIQSLKVIVMQKPESPNFQKVLYKNILIKIFKFYFYLGKIFRIR